MKTKHIICGTLCIIIIFTIGYTGFYVYKLVGNFISYPITLLLKNLKGFYNTAHRLLNQRNISNEKAISKIHQEVAENSWFPRSLSTCCTKCSGQDCRGYFVLFNNTHIPNKAFRWY